MEDIDQIKEILDKDGCSMTDEELQETIPKLKYLIEIWLNEVEQEIFSGKTLNELLMEVNI